jgi:hypothetical protein
MEKQLFDISEVMMGFATIDWRIFDWQVARANLTESVDHQFVHGPWRMVYPQTYDINLVNLAWVRVDEGFGSGLNTYRTNLRQFPTENIEYDIK